MKKWLLEELLYNRSRAGQAIMSMPTGISRISSRVSIQSVEAVRRRSTLTSRPSPFMAGETPCGAAANTSRHVATTFAQGQTFYAMRLAVPANHVMLMPCYVDCSGPPCPHWALCWSIFPLAEIEGLARWGYQRARKRVLPAITLASPIAVWHPPHPIGTLHSRQVPCKPVKSWLIINSDVGGSVQTEKTSIEMWSQNSLSDQPSTTLMEVCQATYVRDVSGRLWLCLVLHQIP